jgi:hypothetical protein
MAAGPSKSSKRVLEPYDRISEILFGLIMVLTFTGSLSVAEAGRAEIRTMLLGALGCNLAWGVIDGVFYLMGCLAEKGRELHALRAVRNAADPAQARRLIAEALPASFRGAVRLDELDAIAQRVKERPEPARRASLDRDDWRGASGVFLLVFLSTLPVAIPFLLMAEARPALRLSNAIAIALLFAMGWAFGRVTGRRPWVAGAAMVVLGGVLVGLTIALGG